MSASFDLARRAVACKRWRWMPGMRSLAHPYMLDGREFVAPARRWTESDGTPKDGRLPDLDDPATLGCLLALVREAWGPNAWVQVIVDGIGASVQDSAVIVTDREGLRYAYRGDIREALVAALEAAPCPA